AVGVDKPPAALLDLAVGLTQEVEAGGTVVARVVGGKQRSDVSQPGSAEHRVDQRMREHVAVRVAGEAAVVVEANTAEHERHAPLECVRVDTDPDPQRHARAPGSSSSEVIRIAPAGGSW